MEDLKGFVEPATPSHTYDVLDKRLLVGLAHNARFSPTQLKKLVNLSKDGIRHRIEKMHKNYTILQNILILNPFVLGFKFHTLALEINFPSINEEMILIGKLAMHPNTAWIGQCLGKYNLIVNIITSKEDTKSIVSQIRKICESNLGKSELVEITQMHSYNLLPKWFINETGISERVLYKQKNSFNEILSYPSINQVKRTSIDKLDVSIIRSLSQDSSKSIANIADELKSPFNTIKNRLRSLIKNEIILAFRPLINSAFLHFFPFVALIKLNSDSEIDNIRSFLKNHGNAGFVLETKGKWSFEWFAANKNNAQIYKDTKELREKFKSIKDITTLFIVKDYKMTFIPEYVLNNGLDSCLMKKRLFKP
ncbi:AsnC family transcriptional regulator [Candidatus Pacearchaeota archaeon]|nr:AsnC family transcriptional regulator [Candidatus Pacearchaeota archaeon]